MPGGKEQGFFFFKWKGWHICQDSLHLPGTAQGQHISFSILPWVSCPLKGYLCLCERPLKHSALHHNPFQLEKPRVFIQGSVKPLVQLQHEGSLRVKEFVTSKSPMITFPSSEDLCCIPCTAAWLVSIVSFKESTEYQHVLNFFWVCWEKGDLKHRKRRNFSCSA